MPGALMLHLISKVSAAAASIGFARQTGNTRLVHGSLSQLLQTFPDTMPALLDSNTDSSLQTSAAADRRTALVFGREESGLTAHELSLCTHSCSIPTGQASRFASVAMAHMQQQGAAAAPMRTVHAFQLRSALSFLAIHKVQAE